jgi:leucyl-tRNA synthetase
MSEYNHKEIEKRWQENWSQNKTFKTPDSVEGKENYYVLSEFAYPSGNLHVGHWYAFAVTDIYAKYQRLLGKNVLFPMGFDSFGLPAENAAIKHGKDPREWTYQNIESMRKQFNSIGASFDWDRKVITSDPEYYKWTQWIFTQMFEKGLAYKKQATVNWDPVDKTVLANEQVMPDGTAERSGAVVEKKEINQWFLKITDYAERLNDDLKDLDWPQQIKEQQKNWIGKSHGSMIDFKIVLDDKHDENSDSSPVKLDSGEQVKIGVFTTRADTLFGCTYVVLAPENPLVEKLRDKITNFDSVLEYREIAAKKTEIERTKEEKDKTGIMLQGVRAINPANGKEIPIFVADYVLNNYGTGAVMAVPAHDERDYAFAQKFDLPINHVVEPVTGEIRENEEKRQSIVALVENPATGDILSINWGKELGGNLLVGGGLSEGEDPIECAKREILEETGYKNIEYVGQTEIIHHHYRAYSKDVNREIDAIGLYFKLVDTEQVDQKLEDDEKDKFTVEWLPREKADKLIIETLHRYVFDKFLNDKIYTDYGILSNSEEFNGMDSETAAIKITEKVGGKMTTNFKLRDWSVGRQRYWGCPVPIVYDPEGKPYIVPKEHLPWTLPTDVDHTPTGEPPLAKSAELRQRTEEIFGKGWTPEVETLDTFIDSSWYFLRYLDSENSNELISPTKEKNWMPIDFYSGGAEHTTLHLLYSRFFHKFLFDIGIVSENEPYKRRLNRGLILGTDGNKMSKSKGNVINPDEIVETLGADTVRLYLAFIGPYNEPGSYPWDPNGVVGVRRFLEKVWRVSDKVLESDTKSSEKVNVEINKLIKKAERDYSELKFNTVVAGMMSFISIAEKEDVSKKDFEKLLMILSAQAPFISEELWKKFGHEDSVFDQNWPEYDEKLILEQQIILGVQINGKVRAEVSLSLDETEDSVKEKVLQIPEIQKWVGDSNIKKFIYIPGKIISIVV